MFRQSRMPSCNLARSRNCLVSRHVDQLLPGHWLLHLSGLEGQRDRLGPGSLALLWRLVRPCLLCLPFHPSGLANRLVREALGRPWVPAAQADLARLSVPQGLLSLARLWARSRPQVRAALD